MQQPADQPKLRFAIDRTKAGEIGLSERDGANSVLLSLSGSGQVQPAYWLNPQFGIQYLINVRAPERDMDSLAAPQGIPVSASRPGEGDAQVLANLASFSRGAGPPVISSYNVMPVIDVFGGVSGRDLGGVLRDLKPLVAQAEKELPRGSYRMLRGQVETMQSSFTGLSIGLVMAMVLIYFLLVVNFQSWLDPFIIITALPGALAGVVWALHLTLTTASAPALMGAIMSLGVATANSAELTMAELPGRIFPAQIVRTSGAMDAQSRTLLTELEVDNSRGEILAGSYAQLRFPEATRNVALTLPSNALRFRAEGPQIGIVLADGKVELRSVKLGRDFGPILEILEGVQPTDRVILNPSDSLVSGITVRVAEGAKPVPPK